MHPNDIICLHVHFTVTRKYYVGLTFLCLTGCLSHYNFRAQTPSHRVIFVLGKHQTQVLLSIELISDAFPPSYSGFEPGCLISRAFVLPLRHQFSSRLIKIIEFGLFILVQILVRLGCFIYLRLKALRVLSVPSCYRF